MSSVPPFSQVETRCKCQDALDLPQGTRHRVAVQSVPPPLLPVPFAPHVSSLYRMKTYISGLVVHMSPKVIELPSAKIEHNPLNPHVNKTTKISPPNHLILQSPFPPRPQREVLFHFSLSCVLSWVLRVTSSTQWTNLCSCLTFT